MTYTPDFTYNPDVPNGHGAPPESLGAGFFFGTAAALGAITLIIVLVLAAARTHQTQTVCGYRNGQIVARVTAPKDNTRISATGLTLAPCP